MNFVKSFLAVVVMLISSQAVAQGVVIYNHRGAHHNTTIAIPFGQPQVRVVPATPAYTTPYYVPPMGGHNLPGGVQYHVPSLPSTPPANLNGVHVNWACATHERPVPANGWHPACAAGNQIRLVPPAEWQVNAVPSAFPAAGQVQRQHAGTMPMNSDGTCPAGTVPSPRVPGQLPGCW